MLEPNGEIQTGRDCPSSSPVVPQRDMLRSQGKQSRNTVA